MYARYFGLNEKPFTIAPDPRFLFQSRRHEEALAHLIYGVKEAGGFIQLTGEVGTGKTTLTRVLLDRLPEKVQVAMILNPRLTVREFLQNICKELCLEWWQEGPAEPRINQLIDVLNKHLLDSHAQGRRVVLIIDEAQNLDAELLEQLRLLTNLETSERKLLQIILIGQPELRQTLARTDLRQLAQRITGRYHLDPLNREETGRYIRHRLKVAGASRQIFTDNAVREVHRLSQGVPRLINVICDRALLGAYSQEKVVVDRSLARQAAAEVHGQDLKSPASGWLKVAAGVVTIALVGAAAWQLVPRDVLAQIPLLGELVTPASAVTDDRNNSGATADVGAARTNNDGEPADMGSPEDPALPPVATSSAADKPETTISTAVTAQNVGAAVAPSQPLLADLQVLLPASRAKTDNNSAFGELFGLWQKRYVRGATRACTQAQRQGLKCLFQRGSWNHLVTLNIPAILSLTDANGDDHQVVLAEVLDEERVLLRIAGESHPVSVRQLNDLWFGDSLLLWRPHEGADRLLGPGARGAGVRWLREGLGKLQIEASPAAGDPTLYDSALAEGVRQFQRNYGLRVDGIAGERTLVKLQALLAEAGVPLLAKDG